MVSTIKGRPETTISSGHLLLLSPNFVNSGFPGVHESQIIFWCLQTLASRGLRVTKEKPDFTLKIPFKMGS
jgi:hypothetical protein